MSEIINYTRLTTSDKVADRFLTCQVYVPQDKDQADLGEIFSHVEIKSPWFGSTQVGQSIINTLIREYYRGHDSSELNNFEEAVKKINESLAKSAQNGETEWIGKLSSVLILVNKSEIHFAQTGKSHAYLYRGGRVNHITEGLEQEDAPHPLKTFSNLTSGSLQENDKIVVANESFFEVINPNELRLIVSSLPPTAAALECAQIIQTHGASDANATFIELTTKEKLADLQPDQKLEAVYLDHQILGISTLSKNAISNISSSISGSAKKSFHKITELISPLAKRGVEKSREKSRDVLAKTKEVTSEQIEKIDNRFSEASINKDSKSFFGKIAGIITKFFLKIKNKLRRNLIHTGIYGKKKSKMYALFLIPVILILIAAISFGIYEKKNNATAKDSENKHNQIISLEGETSILISKNDQASALSKLKEIISIADSLNQTKFADSAKAASQKANTKIIDLIKLQAIEPQLVTKVEDPKSVEYLNESIFVAGTNKFYYKKSSDASLSKGFDLGIGSDEAFSSTVLDESNVIVISKSKKFAKIDLKKNTATAISVEIKNTGPINSFGSNLYLLDNMNSQIYKLANDNGNYQAPTPYLKNNTDVSKVVNFAIDGSVYTIDESGQIAKYSRGIEIGKISLDMPAAEKMKSFQLIKTTEASDYLYLAANDGINYRLIQIKKSGGFIKQYQLQGITTIRDMSINESINEVYILDKDSLATYKIN
jgi:serine/threonine protein phosphatase PrpC